MRVEVLLFAALRDEVGERLGVELSEGATVGALRAELERLHPAFVRYGRRALVAVNETYAHDPQPLAPGDVVAVLPPVAGG
jgi:molybdopterin converting factor subunit 1